MTVLNGKKILVLVSNGVDEGVMSAVQRELLKTGAQLKTASTESGLVNSWNNNTWGLYFPVDQQIGQTLGADFDCLVVPSGQRGIQKLAANPHAERILASFMTAGKPVAFIGGAVELLAKTGLAKDCRVAGPESVQQALTAAGAQWAGPGECIYNNLITGEAADLGAFIGGVTRHFLGPVEMKAAA